MRIGYNLLLITMDIKKKIANKGYTISQVASLMTGKNGEKGVSQSTLSQIIAGNPTIGKLQEIADIIGVPLSELVSDSPRLTALVKVGEVCYQASTIEELEAVVEQIKKRAE